MGQGADAVTRPITVTHEYDARPVLHVDDLINLLAENFGRNDIVLAINLSQVLAIKVQTNDL